MNYLGILFLNPESANAGGIFQLKGSKIDASQVQDSGAVRPVVYLKPSIQITGGDGSEFNPYTLSGN